MGTADRADIGAVVELAQRLRAVRCAARRFIELQEVQESWPLVQHLLDELLEPGAARLHRALVDHSGNV